MATKKTTTPRIPRSKLKSTDLEGVYHTTDGRRVDEHGVDIDFKALKKRDAARFTEVLGKDIESPADLLKAVALDPRNSLTAALTQRTRRLRTSIQSWWQCRAWRADQPSR